MDSCFIDISELVTPDEVISFNLAYEHTLDEEYLYYPSSINGNR